MYYSKSNSNPKLLALIFFFFLFSFITTTNVSPSQKLFSIYPLANDYFDIIYAIYSSSQHTPDQNLIHGEDTIYLRVFCKQHDILSISLSEEIDFMQEPRFPVFSPQQMKIPKFQDQIYTFLSACNVDVKINPNPNSIINIVRKQNNESIFQMKDLHLQPGHNKFTIVDKSIKWGLGERYQKNFKVTDGQWTIYNRDKPWEIDFGKRQRSSQSYGHQPVYLARQKNQGYTHLNYFKNTFGMVIESQKNTDQLAYNSVGGKIHFVLFIGGKDPEATLQRYHDFIGGIHIPPFWSLGFHQCRWGYHNIKKYTQVIQKHQKHDIPLDTMWSDLDYMQKKAIFTIDEDRYPSYQFKKLLNDKNMHWVPLIDVGVSLADMEGINKGVQADVFLRDVHNPAEHYYVGQVWPGKVHYVDFLHPNASNYWQEQLTRLYEKVPFSGVWLDMNEPTNFQGNEPIHEVYKIQKSQNINMMTINNNLKHFNIHNQSDPIPHSQAHSYYGHMSTVPTFDFLKAHKVRPFIISRSNAVGTGAYAGHWTGDNSATWQFLRLSISGNFLFQIFGMQMVGADICGFHDNTNQELCSRWAQLGSLYPFSRNHNQDIAKDQQFYVLGQTVLKTAQVSLKQRYSLLKQLYSILIGLNGKGTFFRPIAFEFYEQENDIVNTLKEQFLQTQFLLGSGIMSAPIVQKSKIKREVYFPGKQDWHMLEYSRESSSADSLGKYTKSNIASSINNDNKKTWFSSGTTSQITNKMTTAPPLFLRGGYMIFTNSPTQRSRFLTNSFYLTAALAKSSSSAENSFLTIKDYENEQILGRCIEQKKCLTKFVLSKLGDVPDDKFKLQWKFDGLLNEQGAFGEIEFKGITVWQQDTEWSSATIIKIDKPNGSIQISLNKVQ